MARSFQYLRPTSTFEAASLRAEHGTGAVLWAGGTDLMLQWRRGAIDIDTCIDLTGLDELRRIVIGEHEITLGAMTTIADLETHSGLREVFPVFADMARRFATPQVRTMATVGGNLCHAVPSADCAPPLIALDATVTLCSPAGERSLPLESFFEGPKLTGLADDEVLARIAIPRPMTDSSCSYQRMVRSAVDIALAGVACRLDAETTGTVTAARIVLGAVAPTPVRSLGAEELLTGIGIGEINDELLGDVADAAAAAAHPISDVRTGASYRRHMTGVLTKRAVTAVAGSLAS